MVQEMLAASGDEDEEKRDGSAHLCVQRGLAEGRQPFPDPVLLHAIQQTAPFGVILKPLHGGPEE